MSFMPLMACRVSAICDSNQVPGVRAGACRLKKRSGRWRGAETTVDVVLNQLLELRCDVLAAQGQGLLAIDENRGGGRLSRAGQADADVSMLAFTRAVDDAALDRHLEVLDAGVLDTPHGHLGPQVAVDVLGLFLERRAGGATTARAGSDAGHEGAQAQGLQDLERHAPF